MSDAVNTAPTPSLADTVAAGWRRHADEPRAVTDALRAALPGVAAAEPQAVADALGLAEHVWLSHLHSVAGFEDFLSALPTGALAAGPALAARQRAQWLLATLGGRAPGDIPWPTRWRASQNLWRLASVSGRAAQACGELQAAVEMAAAQDDAAARRALAATCNNLAVEMRLEPRSDAGFADLMLAAARGSRRLWAMVGGWVQVERAEYQLARCELVAGDAAAALVHARSCHAMVAEHAGEPEADAFERFYAHEVLALAWRASGAAGEAAAERRAMQACLDELADADSRSWAAASMAEYDAAA